MSRLTELLARAWIESPDLARDIEIEVKALSARRSFGLNFERHVPEAVYLPGRRVRVGDKVVRRPASGGAKAVDDSPWVVTGIMRKGGARVAKLIARGPNGDQREVTAPITNLMVVAEFRDPIYPGLRSVGRIESDPGKPWHAVINGENFHALKALRFAYKEKVDCIYIDPPYNTRDKDWKYNNDYVDTDDVYRHSKWLAMMERRLKVAKELLNPEDSCLIVTIDEKECPRLGLLLDQLFPNGTKTMVTCMINPKGVPSNGFSRVNEFIFFVGFGRFTVQPFVDDFLIDRDNTSTRKIRWRGLSRSGANAVRSKSPGAFYPIFVDVETGAIQGAGSALKADESESDVKAPPGTVAVWPTSRPSGEQGRWSVVAETFNELLALGAVKAGKVDIETGSFPFSYLTSEHLEQINAGLIEVTGKSDDGALEVRYAGDDKLLPPKTLWRRTAHSASDHGSTLLRAFIPDRSFPYPKSLYAVEDALRVAVGGKPEALILDFFAGSGTTAHATFRLNRQDGGSRQSISVTNNELSNKEAVACAAKGLRPGDAGWEGLGIFEHVTKPRIEAAVSGRTPAGAPVKGYYAFRDEFPMSDGFEENVEFFDLTYEDPEQVRHDLAFFAVAPLLWMRAGLRGARVDNHSGSFALTDTYGLLFDVDSTAPFLDAVEKATTDLRLVYIFTDDEKQFQIIADQLPLLECVRLYEAYLRTFEISTGSD